MNLEILYDKSTARAGQMTRRGFILGICNIKSLETFFHELFIKELTRKVPSASRISLPLFPSLKSFI
jgi:hypothetical protein